MRLLRPLFAAVYFACISTSLQSIKGTYVVKESYAAPEGWTLLHRTPPHVLLEVNLALKQSDPDLIVNHLYEVSDPQHVRYGQHLSLETISSIAGPSRQTLHAVNEWLESHGLGPADVAYSSAKDWITLTLPVGRLEEMLDTKYYTYTDGVSQRVRTTRWSLPDHLHEHIDLVIPTTAFSKTHAERTMSPSLHRRDVTVPASCNGTVIEPECIRAFYGTLSYKPQVPDEGGIALADFLNNSNNRSDARIFLELFRPEAVDGAAAFKFVSIDNGTTTQTRNRSELNTGRDVEGNIDMQAIISISYPINVTAYSTGGSPPYISDASTVKNSNEPYLPWLLYMVEQPDLPKVISISYDDDEQSVPPSYARRVCQLFAQLGARGVSVFTASGDHGVGRSEKCFANDGTNRSTFLAAFPASCPFVTSVGGTQDFAPEIVAADPENTFYSGGGFSDYFERPPYQALAATAYVTSLGDRFDGLYNRLGRGYPDIAAQGYHYPVVWTGEVLGVDGTSISTPIAASVFALVNDALLAAGRPPLGFLNPWLYSVGFAAMNDITAGSAIGCNSTGFPAAKGWDAVSGFGSPMFPRIMSLLGLEY